MNSSFHDWYQPTQRRYPVENFQPKPTTYSKPSPPPPKKKMKKKVVSIPVRFVGSESTRSESAVQIQKVFRGFMARFRVRQLMALKRDVDEVESAISNEILRIDARERLRLNERLMSLLLKLDSVRGSVSGVRDCRKAVITKAIALQDRIDAIATTTDDQTLEVKQSIQESVSDDDGSVATQAVTAGEICNCEVQPENLLDIGKNASESSKLDAEKGEGRQESEKDDSGEICTCDVEAGNVIDIETVCRKNRSEASVEAPQSSPDPDSEKEVKNGERKRTENERLMAKLMENSEVQMRMIELLRERVEQLERAFLCDKLQKMKKNERKKKKRLEQRRDIYYTTR